MEQEERSSSWMIWEPYFLIGITAEVLVLYGEDSFRKLTPEELLEEQQKENMDEDMNMGM